MEFSSIARHRSPRSDSLDLDQLLHPARAFAHPQDVLNDPDLTLHEKRAILSSWASDACAVESMPALRKPPGVRAPVSFDDIVDALRALDGPEPDHGTIRRRLRRRRIDRTSVPRRPWSLGKRGDPLGA